MVAITLKMLVLFLFNQNDQVTRFSASHTSIALSAKRYVITFRDAGWNIHLHFFFTTLSAFTLAAGAFIFDDTSFSTAIRARLDIYKLSKHRFGYLSNFTHSVTGTAGFKIRF